MCQECTVKQLRAQREAAPPRPRLSCDRCGPHARALYYSPEHWLVFCQHCATKHRHALTLAAFDD